MNAKKRAWIEPYTFMEFSRRNARSITFAPSFFFSIAFLMTAVSGIPFIPLFVLWQGIFSTFGETLYWSFLAGIAMGLLIGEAWTFWVLGMTISGIALYLLRRYIFVKITPATFTVFISLFVSFWYIANRNIYLPQIVLHIILALMLLYCFYAVISKTKQPHQPPLWRYKRRISSPFF